MAAAVHQIVDHPVDLHLIAGAQVEHHRPVRLAQQLGAGEGGDQRDPAALHQGQHRLDGGGAHIAKQGEDPVALDQLGGVAHRQRRFVAIVEADQPQAPAVHAPLAVHLGEIGLGAIAVLPPEHCGGAAQRRRLAQQQLRSRSLTCCSRQTQQSQQAQQS